MARRVIERQQALLARLQEGEATVPELAKSLGCDDNTIRRDIKALQMWGRAITVEKTVRPGRGLGPSVIRLEVAA